MNPMDLINLARDHKIFIQTHNFPDPDALASALGLQSFLAYYGVKSILCYDGKIDKLSTKRMISQFNIDIYSKEETTYMLKKDYIIMVDAQKYNSNMTDFVGNEIGCIDHHPTFISCDYAYKDIRITGACASIIANYYYMTQTPIDPLVAAALLYGIRVDTHDFSRGLTDLDIDMFSYLFKHADRERYYEMLKNTMEFEDLQAYGAAIESIKVFDRTGFATIPFDCPDALIGTISDFILSLNVVDVAIVHAQREDGIKFSVRSEDPKVNAGVLVLQALNDVGSGGGHNSMAGGFITKEKQEILGSNPEFQIQKLFLDTLEQMM